MGIGIQERERERERERDSVRTKKGKHLRKNFRK
jgi:hypothetical protein